MTELDVISESRKASARLKIAICQALAELKVQQDIADELKINDRYIRKVKKEYCPECGIPKGKHS